LYAIEGICEHTESQFYHQQITALHTCGWWAQCQYGRVGMHIGGQWLGEDQVQEIITRYQAGESSTMIAKDFPGLCSTNIINLLYRRDIRTRSRREANLLRAQRQ
jgi:hypothetical protein